MGCLKAESLAPLLLSMCMLTIGQIFHKYSISFHFYADISQIYFLFDSITQHNWSKYNPLFNFLQLNPDKSETTICPDPSSDHILCHLCSISCCIKTRGRNLGVISDKKINFDQKMKSVVQSCFLQLCNILKIRSLML